MPPHVVVTALAALVAGSVAGSVLSASQSTAQVAPTPEGTYQSQIFSTTNDQRDAHDRVELRRQDCVQRYAERQARKMAEAEEIFHQDLQRVLRDCGLSRAGENVAYGFEDGRSVVNQGWMRSAGHRANILNPRFRLLGTGAREGDDNLWYAVQVFGRR